MPAKSGDHPTATAWAAVIGGLGVDHLAGLRVDQLGPSLGTLGLRRREPHGPDRPRWITPSPMGVIRSGRRRIAALRRLACDRRGRGGTFEGKSIGSRRSRRASSRPAATEPPPDEQVCPRWGSFAAAAKTLLGLLTRRPRAPSLPWWSSSRRRLRRGPAAAWARAPRVGAELGATSPSGCRDRPLPGGLPVDPRLVAGSTTRKRLSGAFGQAPGGASTNERRECRRPAGRERPARAERQETGRA
jgi:hypothetical protein